MPRLEVVINPEIILKSWVVRSDLEGCLSWGEPIKFIKVTRHRWITVKFLDGAFQPKEIKLTNFPARVFQHELDHLNGRCIHKHP